MASSSPLITVLQLSKISPPPATLQNRSLALTFFDIIWLPEPPLHQVFFYDLPGITRTHFIKTILPNLNRSLSTTLQYFFPHAGNLIIFPTPTKKPEIRYVQGDYVNVTYSECNLDFNYLTGNHPRKCDKFYHLIPPLGQSVKMYEYKRIPIFAVQITLFPDNGISIGLSFHHSIGDATTQLSFYKAWALISEYGSDELFLARGTFPLYDRVISDPTQDEEMLERVYVESLKNQKELFQPQHLSGPIDKLRATFIMTRSVINRLKKLVSTQLPTLTHVSSFTVSCAFIWTCLAKSCDTDQLNTFVILISCRERVDPKIPATYFGNCLKMCPNIATTTDLVKNEGFVAIAKLVGENLHKLLTTEGGIMMANRGPFPEEKLTNLIGVAGSPRVNFYDVNFGWGNPKKYEIISIDYSRSISINVCKESDQDLEIGICLSPTEMQTFVRIFHEGVQLLRPHIASKF